LYHHPKPVADRPLYECIHCGSRTDDVSDGRLCDCGGYYQNIGVSREQ